jgi:tellurite resistance protein TehA-like permease
MAITSMSEQAQRVTRFVTVQLIALVGWIVVQSCFSLTPLGRSLPFAVMIVVEGIWWIATLLILFALYRREYQRFVRSALELEEANRRLRERTNSILVHLEQSGSDQPKRPYRAEDGPGQR